MVALIWLGIAVLIGIAEVLGAGGFLIGAGIAALAMAVATWIFPDLGIITQLIYFAISATIATILYIKYFRSTDPQKRVDLHDKVSNMVGKQFVLADELTANVSKRTQIDDTLWTVKSGTDAPTGSTMRIVGGSSSEIEVEVVAPTQ